MVQSQCIGIFIINIQAGCEQVFYLIKQMAIKQLYFFLNMLQSPISWEFGEKENLDDLKICSFAVCKKIDTLL
jgi:hypothetical protein